MSPAKHKHPAAGPLGGPAQTLLAAALACGDQCYDPAEGLCVDTEASGDPYVGRKYCGHFVAWRSPAYAEALLASGRDIRRAARIIERICDCQEMDPTRPEYGNFRAIAEWDGIRDTNAGPFLAVRMGWIWHLYRELLPKRTQRRMLRAFDALATYLIRSRTVVFYTNVFLLRLSGKLLLAGALDREELLRSARLDWSAFVDYTARHNLSEYNAPTYNAVHVECLLSISRFAPWKRVRTQARAALEYVLALHCLHHHRPSRSSSGVMSRAYRIGLLNHVENSTLLNHALFGEPLPDGWAESAGPGPVLNGAAWSRDRYTPPPHLRRMFADKAFPITIREQVTSFWGRDSEPRVIRCTCHQTKTYSLASQYGVWANYGHYLPFHFTHAGPERRRSIFFQHDSGRPLIDAWFAQRGGTAVGAFFWGIPDYETFRFWWNAPPFEAGLVCYLGDPKEMREFLVDGEPWDGRRQPGIGSTLVIRKAKVAVRLRLLRPPAGTRAPTVKLQRADGDAVMHFVFGRSQSADRFWRMPPAVLPLAFEVLPARGETPPRPLRAKKTAGAWEMHLGPLSARVPLTLQARQHLAERSSPPITGPFLQSPPFSVAGADDMRRVLRLDPKSNSRP